MDIILLIVPKEVDKRNITAHLTAKSAQEYLSSNYATSIQERSRICKVPLISPISSANALDEANLCCGQICDKANLLKSIIELVAIPTTSVKAS